jgi:hypothetical protein
LAAGDSFGISGSKFMNPMENSCSLMWTSRSRFDVLETLRQSSADFFSRAESAAFHGRKIVEAIAFACLVAIDNDLNYVPRDAEKQWNAETIFQNLQSKNLKVLQSPSIFRHTYVKEKTSLRHKCDS